MRTKTPTAQQEAARLALEYFRMVYTYGWVTEIGYDRGLDAEFEKFTSTLNEAELAILRELLNTLRQFQHENPNPHPKPRS